MKQFIKYLLLALGVSPLVVLAQGRVIINEIMASNQSAHLDEFGEADDWLELRSLSDATIDVAGMFLLVEHEIWEIPQGRPDLTRIPAKDHLVLWFDGQVEQGALHAPFTLPRSGATVLLIDKDGSTLLDAFSYSEQRSDISFGRSYSALESAVFYRTCTPAAPNIGEPAISILTIPEATHSSGTYKEAFNLQLNCANGKVHYTLNNNAPFTESATAYKGPIRIDKTTVIRAMCIEKGNIESVELVQTYLFDDQVNGPVVSLVLDPDHLWDDTVGIHTFGVYDNYSQRGSEWERPASFEFLDPAYPSRPYQVELSIAGNGSRSLPKKSFEIKGQKRYGSDRILLPFKEELSNKPLSTYKLRADAAGGGHLKERFVHALNKYANGALVMQESLPVELYLNGVYWGFYELMSAKGSAFWAALHGAGDLDILTGPSGAVRKGDRSSYEALLELANDPRISTGALHEEIAAVVDLDNFIDYWVFEVFTAKLDNSTNLRYSRPRQQDGRWRWITYDMDLWGEPNDHTLARVLDPKDLHEYPLTGLLMHDPLIRDRFINRMADLLNTSFDPTITQKLLDQVAGSVHDLRMRDEIRWKDEMTLADHVFAEMSTHLKERPAVLVKQIGHQFNISPVKVQIRSSGKGHVKVNSILLDQDEELTYFSRVVIRLEAIPKAGQRFVGWKGSIVSESPVIHADPAMLHTIKARFVKETSSWNSLEDGLEEGPSINIP